MRPIRLFQGTDRNINANHTETALTSASEITFVIDSEPQTVTKTLSGGDIVGVSATSLTVQLTAADTALMNPGEYDIDMHYTDGTGRLVYGRWSPNSVRVIDTGFE